MEKTQKQRVYILDIIRGIAILNIIYIHTVWWSGTFYVHHDILRQISLLIDVPLFFFLSGWASSLQEYTIKKTMKRFIKLYIPYLIMIFVLGFSLIFFYQRDITLDIFIGWLTIIFRESFEIPVVMGSMWFLPPFIIISIITPLLGRILKDKEISFFFIILLIFINFIFSYLNPNIGNVLILKAVSLRVITFYLLIYFLGMYTRNIYFSFKQFTVAFISLSIVFLIYLSSLNYEFDLQINKFPPSMFYFISSMFSIIITVYLKNYENKAVEVIKKNKLIKFLSYSGVNSYNIFLYQGFGASFLFILISNTKFQSLHWTILLPICFIVNIAVSYLLSFELGKINKLVLDFIDKNTKRFL